MVGVRLDATKELVATMKDVANELRARFGLVTAHLLCPIERPIAQSLNGER